MKNLKIMLGIAWGIFAGGALGGSDPYYTKVISAAGFLSQAGTNHVSISEVETSGNGLVSQEFRFGNDIGNDKIKIASQDGLIVGMSLSGQSFDLKIPKLALKGDAEWVRLSEFFQREAIRQMSFPRFFFLSSSAPRRDCVLQTKKVTENIVEAVDSTTGWHRILVFSPNDTISHVYDVRYEGDEPCFAGSMTFGLGGRFCSSYSDQNLIASFYSNGGLKKLRVLNTKSKYGISYRSMEWNAQGKLIKDLDLTNQPHTRTEFRGLELKR